MSKCVFAQRKVEYLGHIISDDGVEAGPNKVNDMLSWALP